MPVVISMLRGVNLAAHKRVKMDALRELYLSLKLRNPQTYLQSGNVIFQTKEQDLVLLATRIESAIERKFGFSSDVILRTPADLRDVITRNPFAGRPDIEPNKLLVTFLRCDPGVEACDKIRQMKPYPDEVRIDGREMYTYYTSVARPVISWAVIEKALKTSGTARNWNSVTRLLEMAEALETS
ncbi:MAG TPA: DUF1697 domain-containing protein [Bryobacteraceae bacterium]|jgi:uncharacterized protein (DUF1697 family)